VAGTNERIQMEAKDNDDMARRNNKGGRRKESSKVYL